MGNRKGKLIFFYEWEIAVKWKGHANGGHRGDGEDRDTQLVRGARRHGRCGCGRHLDHQGSRGDRLEGDVEERPRGKEGPRAALQLCAGFEERVQQRVDLAKEGPNCCSCQDFCCCETCQQVCWWANK